MIREQRSRESRPELEPSHDAIAAAVPAGAARAAADRELAHQHRERALQDLRIGQPRVGHVGLYGVAAVEVRSRARAARDGLVVLQPLVAEGQVVHGSLGGGENPERAVEGIHDALRGLDVPGSHRGRRPGVEERPRRNHELEGLEAALVQRNRPLDERAEHIQHRRRAHRARRVEVVCALGRGAGEVDARAAPLAIDVDAHRDELTVIHRVAKAPGLQSPDGVAHRVRGVVLHQAHVGAHRIQPVAPHRALDLGNAARVGRELRPQVRDVLVRLAGRPRTRRERRAQPALAQLPAAHQRKALEQRAFLLDGAAEGRHRAGGHAADVGVMRS